MRLPDFLGIGTQKGGTTFLHGLLQQHPQVFMAHPKELHYFSLHHGQGLEWYAKYFAQAPIEQRCGEVTPYYLFHPLAAERIHAAIPNVKLIVLLRDPVERALSQYFHSKRLGLETLELEDALGEEPGRLADAEVALNKGEPHRSHQQHSYISRSRYEKQLPKFQELFGSPQVLVLRSEDLFEQPHRAWGDVLRFLGLDDVAYPTTTITYSGNGEAFSISDEIRKKMNQELIPTYRWIEHQHETMLETVQNQ